MPVVSGRGGNGGQGGKDTLACGLQRGQRTGGFRPYSVNLTSTMRAGDSGQYPRYGGSSSADVCKCIL